MDGYGIKRHFPTPTPPPIPDPTTFNSIHMEGIRMSSNNRVPAFGGKKKQDDYYTSVNSIINVLRPKATLAVIAEHLNRASFTTPTNLTWNRSRVASYLQSTSYN